MSHGVYIYIYIHTYISGNCHKFVQMVTRLTCKLAEDPPEAEGIILMKGPVPLTCPCGGVRRVGEPMRM